MGVSRDYRDFFVLELNPLSPISHDGHKVTSHYLFASRDKSFIAKLDLYAIYYCHSDKDETV